LLINVMDLFCGTGGFSYGFSKAGQFQTVFAIDLLSDAAATTQANHPDAKVLKGDIRRARPSEIASIPQMSRDVDVIIGGPPCQGFSSIRPFRSSKDDDPRNDLFQQFALYVNYFRPKVLVFENVVGLATYESGRTLEIIQEVFCNIGYETEWHILNAANYGVPQKRERLILIGVQPGIHIRFPEPTYFFNGKTIGFRNKSQMITTPDDIFNRHLPNALTVMDAIGDLPPIGSGEDGADTYYSEPQNQYQRERRGSSRVLTLHESTRHTPRMLEIIRHSGRNIDHIPAHLISSGFSSSYSRLSPNEPSATITVNFVHPASNKCIHPFQNRALTPREGARLQSFDDHFRFVGSRTQIVKQIGNAVPPLMGYAIAKAVLEMLGLVHDSNARGIARS